MAQNLYAVMQWTNDGNRLSVHHLKYIREPKKAWNAYKAGDVGNVIYPGFPGIWDFVILAVGEDMGSTDDRACYYNQEKKQKCSCEIKFEDLSDEVTRLKRRVRKLEAAMQGQTSTRQAATFLTTTSSTPGKALQTPFPGNVASPKASAMSTGSCTMVTSPSVSPAAAGESPALLDDSALMALIAGMKVQDAIKKIALELFSENELKDNSITGKKTVQCGETSPRPALDQRRLQTLFSVILCRYSDSQRKDIVAKLQNIQKVLCRK